MITSSPDGKKESPAVVMDAGLPAAIEDATESDLIGRPCRMDGIEEMESDRIAGDGRALTMDNGMDESESDRIGYP